MPSLRGLTVHVTNKEGQSLDELGEQFLRKTANGEKVSAYIKSTFRVSVQPKIPFIDADYSESEQEPDDKQAMTRSKNKKSSRYRRISKKFANSVCHPHSGSKDSSPDHNYDHKNYDTRLICSPPVPKYSFLASLYLDGRSIPERRIVVYLDPADKDFNAPDGKVHFRHRWVQSKNGSLTEQAWVFKEKAIEGVFDRLMISGDQFHSEGYDEDAIVQAMQSAGLAKEGDFGNEKNKIGQIVVEIRRIVLGQKTYDNNYRSKHQEGRDEEDINMDGTKSEITHATGFSPVKTIAPAPLRVVDYYDYKLGEGNWATFQFFYRSAEQLQKLGFGDYRPRSRTIKTGRSLNARMADLTPLSIGHQVQSTGKKPKQGHSYEDKVKSKAFMVENDEPKPEFASDYRDASADDDFDAEETNKYPQAPLPFLIPKAPRLAPQRSNSIPGLPSLDSELESAVASAIASKVTAATAPANLEQAKGTISNHPDSPAQSFPATASTTVYNPDRDPRRRPKPYPDLGEASASFLSRKPSTSLTENGSALPSVTKENIAKLNNISPSTYRPSPLAPTQDTEGDDEDADDELNTESDLETHADDDDFEYGANAEGNEEENDEGYENLRVRFKNVDLKKRTFAELEAAQPGDDEAEKEIGDTMTGGGDEQEKIGSIMSVTEVEKEHLRRDKKART